MGMDAQAIFDNQYSSRIEQMRADAERHKKILMEAEAMRKQEEADRKQADDALRHTRRMREAIVCDKAPTLVWRSDKVFVNRYPKISKELHRAINQTTDIEVLREELRKQLNSKHSVEEQLEKERERSRMLKDQNKLLRKAIQEMRRLVKNAARFCLKEVDAIGDPRKNKQ